MSDKLQASDIVSNAYQMFTGNPNSYADDPFPMYSYEKPARLFWEGFVSKLIEDGATKDQIEWLLRSKHMRWMFDADEDRVVELGALMAEGYMEVIKDYEAEK